MTSADLIQTNGSAIWQQRLDGLLNRTISLFFPDGIAYEISCEPKLSCTTDMYSFKSYLTRWLAATTKVAPYTYDTILPVLKSSAVAAAQQCSGGDNGRMCGLSWSKGTVWDGTQGVGQEMAAMSVIFTNLLAFNQGVDILPPVTNMTGGTSVGNPNAGAHSVADPTAIAPATSGDKAGAGFVTALVLVGATGMFGWMSL
jgi:mannan endo-1,6-alpha-mannosidase